MDRTSWASLTRPEILGSPPPYGFILSNSADLFSEKAAEIADGSPLEEQAVSDSYGKDPDTNRPKS